MARGVRFLLGFRQYPFLKKNGPGIPVFGYCPTSKVMTRNVIGQIVPHGLYLNALCLCQAVFGHTFTHMSHLLASGGPPGALRGPLPG